MKSNKRYLRVRSGGREITIPRHFIEILGFYKIDNKIVNTYGRKTTVYAWLNSKNNIEIANEELKLENSIGVVLRENTISSRGGTFGLIVPFLLMETYKILDRHIRAFSLTSNELDHLELIPEKN